MGVVRHIDDDERRHRLAVRHALAPAHHADDVVGAADAVVALHGTDPASTMLSALARAPHLGTPDVERALYDDRVLVRVLAMRRTVFAVRHDLATTCLAACDGVDRSERNKLLALLSKAEVPDPQGFLNAAEADALAVFDRLDTVTTKDLSAASDRLATRLRIGSGKWANEVSIASRVLTVLATRGDVVRARPRGGWTSTQFTWARADRWHTVLSDRPEPEVAAARLAEAWLARYGPATPEDLQWWTGWTKTRTRAALAALDLVKVETVAGPAVVLADDVDPVGSPEPWVALLPALDPTPMGWKHRDHLLGPHREQVYDANGNAGATVWVDGRVVGGWTQRDDGEVVTELLEDVGRDSAELVARHAAALTERLADVRVKARARGWTPVENRLRA